MHMRPAYLAAPEHGGAPTGTAGPRPMRMHVCVCLHGGSALLSAMGIEKRLPSGPTDTHAHLQMRMLWSCLSSRYEHPDVACHEHICTGTRLTAALPHLHRDRGPVCELVQTVH